MTTKFTGPCQHGRQEALDRNTGDCRACGASAVKVIDDLHRRIADLTRRLENECLRDYGQ